MIEFAGMEALLEWASSLIISAINAAGYFGIALFMALESANIPIPSEIIMPFSGFVASQGTLSFLWVVVWGALGNLIGSLASYALGYWGGRPFLLKYGRFLFLSEHEVKSAERVFARYGSRIVLWSRLLPVVRTFISFPAGIARMNIWKFSLYTFAGSLAWSWFLAYVGFQTGERWNVLEPYFRRFDWFFLLFFGIVGAWWVYKKIR